MTRPWHDLCGYGIDTANPGHIKVIPRDRLVDFSWYHGIGLQVLPDKTRVVG